VHLRFYVYKPETYWVCVIPLDHSGEYSQAFTTGRLGPSWGQTKRRVCSRNAGAAYSPLDRAPSTLAVGLDCHNGRAVRSLQHSDMMTTNIASHYGGEGKEERRGAGRAWMSKGWSVLPTCRKNSPSLPSNAIAVFMRFRAGFHFQLTTGPLLSYPSETAKQRTYSRQTM